jgi:hypothetical protein
MGPVSIENPTAAERGRKEEGRKIGGGLRYLRLGGEGDTQFLRTLPLGGIGKLCREAHSSTGHLTKKGRRGSRSAKFGEFA